MSKDQNKQDSISESGNWNVASEYSKKKIMTPLIAADYYQDIAEFGSESIIDEIVNFNFPEDLTRYKALGRLISALVKVINNSKFALKKPGTKKIALTYKKQLLSLKRGLPRLVEKFYDNNTNTETVRINNQTVFSKVLQIVTEIQAKINEPLNQNHLIFVDKKEFDPREFKDRIKARMVNQG